MMTPLIFSCNRTSVLDYFGLGGNCHRTLTELLPEMTDEILQRGGHFSVLRSIRMIVHLMCSPFPARLSALANSPRPLFALRWSDHGHLRVQTGYNHCLD